VDSYDLALNQKPAKKCTGKRLWPGCCLLPARQSAQVETSRNGIGPGTLQPRHMTQARCGQALGKGRQVVFQTRGLRLDDVGHPASQLQAVASDGLGSQHGVVDAAQAYT